MNTNTNAIETVAAPTSRPLGRKLRVVIVGFVVSILSALALTTTTAQPAAAAGGVSYCFKHVGGGAYTYDAFLVLYMNGRWTAVQNLGRSANGCKSVTISGTWRNYPARVDAYYTCSTNCGGKIWYGRTPCTTLPPVPTPTTSVRGT